MSQKKFHSQFDIKEFQSKNYELNSITETKLSDPTYLLCLFESIFWEIKVAIAKVNWVLHFNAVTKIEKQWKRLASL